MASGPDSGRSAGGIYNPGAYILDTAARVLPGVFAGGPRGPTEGQAQRLTEAGYVRQETRGGRFPLVTWLTPTGQPISNEAAAGVARQLPRTPPIAPPAPPATTELDRLLRGTFVPRGGTVSGQPPSDFDRLMRGSVIGTRGTPGINPNVPSGAAAGMAEYGAALIGQSVFTAYVLPWLQRRRLRLDRKGPRKRPRVQRWPDSVRPPSVPPSTPALPLPRVPEAPPRAAPAPSPRLETRAPRLPPGYTVAESYRVPSPSFPASQLPQTMPRPVPARTPAAPPSGFPSPLLLPLVALLGLPSPRANVRQFVAPVPGPGIGMTNNPPPITYTPPRPAPLTALQTAPLPSPSSNCGCPPSSRPTSSRTRTPKCTNPIVSKRTRGNLIITTRERKCR